MLAVLPVFRCCFSCLLFSFTVFLGQVTFIWLFCFLLLSLPLLHCIILSDSLPAVFQDVIYSAEVRGRFGYDQ